MFPTEQSTAWGRPGPQAPGWDFTGYQTGITDHAVGIIENAGPEPLFLHYTPYVPHNPIAPEPSHQGVSRAGPYGDFIAQLDEDVGRIKDAIAVRGRPALVILTSDNGSGGYTGLGPNYGAKGSIVSTYGHKPNGPLRDWKHSIYEGGVRVPFIVWWPGVVPAGVMSRDQVTTVDLYRTIARIVGYQVPADQGHDSFDFWPSVVPSASRNTPQRTWTIIQDNRGNYALVNIRFKVINAKVEMYDLENDDIESTNVWDTMPGVRSILSQHLTSAIHSARTHP